MDNTSDNGSRFSRGLLAVCVALATTLGLATSASAQVVDPTGDAMSDIQGTITTWVTTYGIPAVVAILGLGVGLALLIKFARKAKSAV